MLVALYFDGKFTRGAEGAQYTKEAAYGFEVNENTSFVELKGIVYEKIGVNPNRCDIDLATRINTVSGGRPYYTRYPITNESVWRSVYNTFQSQGIMVMDLYSRRVQREPGVGTSRKNRGLGV